MNKTITLVLVLVIVVFGGYFLLRGKAQAPTQETPKTLSTETPAINKSSKQYVITYTDAGYAPNTLTVKLGDTVTWANDSSLNMWPASAMHPSHIVYSGTSISEHCPDTAGTSFDACKGIVPGNSWDFTFNKKGSWKYHDHLTPKYFGTIIVE